MEPFIMNHQFNMIKKQTKSILDAYKSVSDRKVLEAVRYSAESKVIEMFPQATAIQKQLLDKISQLKTAEEFQQYLQSLAPYVVEFPNVTEKQTKKLFPKNKKLKLPDLSAINHQALTYLGWVDISTTKMFFVYPLNGEVIGVEGKFTPVNKKNVCSLCNGYGEVALVTAISKTRQSHLPDYYKAVGNYMCLDSHECNKNITAVTSLERFIQDVLG